MLCGDGRGAAGDTISLGVEGLGFCGLGYRVRVSEVSVLVSVIVEHHLAPQVPGSHGLIDSDSACLAPNWSNNLHPEHWKKLNFPACTLSPTPKRVASIKG